MSDINVTLAANWTEDEYQKNIEYLESVGLDDFAAQAKKFRSQGKSTAKKDDDK